MKTSITALQLKIAICLFIFWLSTFATDRESVANPTIELRYQLIEKLDSLDIEKQEKKRNGESIEEVELQQKNLQDSIKSLRTKIQNEAIQPETPKKEHLISINSLIHPQSSFDWIILVSGSVASFSFLFLIFAIVNILSKRPKKAHKKLPKKQIKPQSTSDQPVGKKLFAPTDPGINQKDDFKTSVNQDLEFLNQLKKRINENVTETERQGARPPTRILKAATLQSPMPSDNDLDTKIVNAYQNGADIQEISRQFHLSADHVSLILKINGTKFNR